jgi:uncharacterized protein YjgD (DUF1641 family)
MADQNSTPTDGETEPDAAESADAEIPPAVAEAIADNPEEIARLLDRLGALNAALDATDVASGALDDRMVQELAGTGANLAAAADGLATEEAAALGEAAGENAEELAAAIEGMARLQRSGTLDDLLAVADVLSLATNAMDDDMVTTLAGTGSRLGEVVDTAADEDVARGLESTLAAVGEASAEPPREIGAVGLLRAMRDPEVRTGMGFLVQLAGAIGRERRAGGQD